MVRTLIGFPGSWADDERESSDHYTTKIGGLPDWPPLSEDALRTELLSCRSCGSRLSLVAQVYAPISTENSNIEERTVYVFGCLMLNCGTSEQSWRIFRVQKAHDEKEPSRLSGISAASPPALASKTNLWDLGGDEDDEDFDLGSLAEALSEAAAVASNSKKQTKSGSKSGLETKVKHSPLKSTTRVGGENSQVVPCFYIHSQEESPSKDVGSLAMNYSALSIRDRETENDDEHGSEEKWEDEKYEYDKALNADRTYLKFKKRLDANPEQCFRYSYGGKPLLATEIVKAPEKCERCGSPRLFEMQLMPPLIYFLQEAVLDNSLKQSLDNWDWMTLIIHTCSKSCSRTVEEDKSVTDGDWIVAEEFITVQYEQPMNLERVNYFQ
ncbi:PREDICTED: programmed cell death protein 2-like isoform X2 [Tarenaya hassleriana]|uniref:programmed cell death protein 2-like isoform X2 n=1 Tax=Tarenaya hassleriana TaxID=28532 RepID=UPI00053CA0DA|nr:PREDICTED: programmed cell death protein 2-like isoform X2 [Tarenaya hassleriana]